MAQYSPVYCGYCEETGESPIPPEAPACPHFHDPNTIWLAAAGRAIVEASERTDRVHTKYRIHHPVDHPQHPAFEPVVREKNTWSDTFKLPLVNGTRIHVEETPHGPGFATLHGPESDPDPPATLGQLLAHTLEVGAHHSDTFRNRARLGIETDDDPLYILPEDREAALAVAATTRKTGANSEAV